MQQRSYVRLTFISCAIGLVLSAALNFAVDPYGVHRWIDRAGFNRLKPKSEFHSQMVKPYRVLEVRPKTLLLGNSRVEVGINPESPQWPAALRPVYNMALPGTGVATSLRSLQHANSNSKVDLVVMGVDFFDFLSSDPEAASSPGKPKEASEFDKRLLVNTDGARNQQRWLQVVRDRLGEIFSLNTLADSIYTIATQRLPDQADLTALGFNPLHEYRRFVQLDGYEVLFRQVETEYLRNYLRTHLILYDKGTTSSDALDRLRDLIALCRASNIRLILYVYPYHAHMLENYRISGMWPLFEEWKRVLVRIVEESAAQPGSGTVELWDFSGYNEFTSEPVPGSSEKGRAMRWYWEAGHYKQELGEVVLARILGGGGVAGLPPADFGVRLNGRNIDSQLEAIRNGQRQYAEARHDEVEILEKRAQAIRAQSKAKVP
jgi:hypothetical protein